TINYMNEKTIIYMEFPKEGGKVNGKITGLCNATITGEFNGKVVDDPVTSGQDIKGEATGTCKIGFIPVPAYAKFSGEVSFLIKRMSLAVKIDKPFWGRYFPSLIIE
ncbi:MAG: hypothetical protein NUV73_03555, partial [Candidatus Daviesbacteria bacterium]|nr:hypothetical protein [Candidatus Daviesbacteria bacterium]